MTEDQTVEENIKALDREALEERCLVLHRVLMARTKIEDDNIYLAVAGQHFHFKNEGPATPEHLNAREKKFRFRCMREELEEYEDAETLEEELDALVDLVVFALGTATRQGFHYFNEAVQRVVAANKKKVVGPTANRGGKFGDLDLQKPPDWTPADLKDLTEGRRKNV